MGEFEHQRTQDLKLLMKNEMFQGQAIDSEHLSELTEEETEVSFLQSRIRGFALWDLKFFIPFFTRRFTQEELKDCKSQMTDLTNQWYQAIRISPLESDDETPIAPKKQLNINIPGHKKDKKGYPSHGSILNI